MLGSDHAGERAAAGLKAHNLLQERRLSWTDVIARALPPPQQPRREYTGGRRHHARAVDLLACGFSWNDWEVRFLNSIAGWRGDLTPKQVSLLNDLGAAADAWLATQGGECEF
jgi:hypothetical protein